MAAATTRRRGCPSSIAGTPLKPRSGGLPPPSRHEARSQAEAGCRLPAMPPQLPPTLLGCSSGGSDVGATTHRSCAVPLHEPMPVSAAAAAAESAPPPCRACCAVRRQASCASCAVPLRSTPLIQATEAAPITYRVFLDSVTGSVDASTRKSALASPAAPCSPNSSLRCCAGGTVPSCDTNLPDSSLTSAG